VEKKIFISSTEPRSGKSLFTIGLINALLGIVPRVGYMKPIGQWHEPESSVDEDALLIREAFGLQDDPSDINPLSMEQAQEDRDDIFERIFDSYQKIAAGRNFVVFEGTDYTSAVTALEFDINAELAKNLGAPVLLVARGRGKTVDDIVQNIRECTESFRSMGCEFIGSVVNLFDSPDYETDMELIREELDRESIPVFGTLLFHPTLAGPRLHEVAETLGARVLFKGDDMRRVVTDVRVLAMTPENALGYMQGPDGCLLITPGDRIENIFSALIAQNSAHYPNFSGLVLTGGLTPGRNVMDLIGGCAGTDLTILGVNTDTYTTALQINGIAGELKGNDTEKLKLAFRLVDRYVNTDEIDKRIGQIRTDTVTPRMFQYRIIQMARQARKHIVLPEGGEERIVQGAGEVLRRGVCDVTLIGERKRIEEVCRKRGTDITGARIIDPEEYDPSVLEEYTEAFYELRKHKGVTREMAAELMADPVNYAAMMVRMGAADGFVSGSVHSTAHTLGPVLRIIRTRKDVSLASSIFFMCMPDKVLAYGDCALVENPDAAQLADIAITSAETARIFGIEPIVALLSYSTGESGRGKDVDKVREAARIARERRPELAIEGPLQYDAATSQEVAKVKIRDSAVAGRATVYIFPDLDAGNTAYKAVQRSAGVPAIGPVLQGLNHPANDLSRGADVTDILYTIAITAVQAQQVKNTSQAQA